MSFATNHRSSYSVELNGEKETRYIWTPIELPNDEQEWSDLFNGEFDLKLPASVDQSDTEVVVSYKDGKGVNFPVSFVQKMFIDGLKLAINAAVRPKADGVNANEELDKYIASLDSSSPEYRKAMSIKENFSDDSGIVKKLLKNVKWI